MKEAGFKSYKKPIDQFFGKGILLETFKSSEEVDSEIKMEEHEVNLYGDLVASAVAFAFVIFVLSSNLETNGQDLALYFMLLVFTLFGIFLFTSAIKKLRNSKNKTYLIIDDRGIRYFESTSSTLFESSWEEIQEIAIECFRGQTGYKSYLILETNKSQFHRLDISLLYTKNSKQIILSDFKKSLNVSTPEFLEIRKTIGLYHNDKKPTGNFA